VTCFSRRPLDDREEPLYLALGNGRRRLVHDDDVRVRGDRLGYLDDLLPRDAQSADELLRIDGRLDALHHVDDLGYLIRLPEEAEGGVLHAQGQVFLDRQLVYDVQLLEEGAYPLCLASFVDRA
jgi:hypothetical protein